MQINRNDLVELQYSQNEEEAVKIAVSNLKSDLFKVLGCRVCLHEAEDTLAKKVYGVQNGPCAISDSTHFASLYGIKKIVVATKAHFDAHQLQDTLIAGDLPDSKEAYEIHVWRNVLYLCGNDKRGTIYAVYEFCEMLGVSPWHFFADVPVKRKQLFVLEEGFVKKDFPSVEYRGIFINDEEELEKWVHAYMAEETIGPKTYAHIFELLLRLKCNYIWPAMHVNSFNANVENGALAERMGIVVGTSHCDMLMRSNNREWEPWKKKKGYQNVEYDFSIEGENREKLLEYWRESVEQNKDFEVTYTLGMRGIHDSGFLTKSLEKLEGEALLEGKKKLLEDVFAAQNRILSQVAHKEALKLFVPYKEVLELYDNGLQVPEDCTLIWTNDNYGYVRRYPDENAQKRKGGNGIYYHQSYWAPPEGSYLFICSIPAAQTRNELKKAYENGVQKLWVTNFGAIKPLEQQLSFYACLAWSIGKEDDPTEDVAGFLENWLNKTFSGNHGRKLAKLLTQFDQVVNMRKIEWMDNGAFYQSEKTDEAFGRVCFLRKVFESVNEVYAALPKEEQDAFFQMILLRVHAAYYTNAMYYYADRSVILTHMSENEDACKLADECLKLSEAFDRARQELIYYYNHVMSNGKWYGIVTPEDYPPPRTAMYPIAVSREYVEKKLGFYPEHGYPRAVDEEPAKHVTRMAVQAPEHETKTGQEKVCCAPAKDAVKVIPYLGRGEGSLVEFESEAASLSYEFDLKEAGEYYLSIERFPSLNSVGEISIEYTIEGIHENNSLHENQKTGKLVSLSNDEHRGTWKKNVLDNVDWLQACIGQLAAGKYRVTLHHATRYFAFSKIHLHNKKLDRHPFWSDKPAQSFTASLVSDVKRELEAARKHIYGDVTLDKRSELVLPIGFSGNVLSNEDMYVRDISEVFGADRIEVRVADALKQNDRAWFFGQAPDFGVGVGRENISLFYRKKMDFLHEPCGVGYAFTSKRAKYTIWVCLYTKGDEAYAFQVSVDQKNLLASNDTSRSLWRYSSENVYKWIPIGSVDLQEGKHELVFSFLSNRLRLEGLCLCECNHAD